MVDGTQALAVNATDAAGNVSRDGPITVRVDNTAPGAVAVDLDGGDAWRNTNDFDLSWTNAPEGDRAPISGAYTKICSSTGTACSTKGHPGGNISSLPNTTVPGPGEWQLRLWRQDAAGNQEPANASVPITLRFDPEPPELAFETSPSSDPTLISVAVTDKISGLAGGQIEIEQARFRYMASAEHTSVQGSRLVARVDDSLLPPGVYQVRATARDRASNQNSTDRRTNGQPMTVTLPLRITTTMKAGVVGERIVSRVIKRRGKRRRVRRRVETVRQQARVEYGEQVDIEGRLQNRDGQPIPARRWKSSHVAPPLPSSWSAWYNRRRGQLHLPGDGRRNSHAPVCLPRDSTRCCPRRPRSA